MCQQNREAKLDAPNTGNVKLPTVQGDALDALDDVVRLVNPTVHIKWNVNPPRISSALFAAASSDGGVSVDSVGLVEASGQTCSNYVDSRTTTNPSWGAIKLRVGEITARGHPVIYSPILEGQVGGPNPYHSDIKGVSTTSQKKALSKLPSIAWVKKAEGLA